MNSIKSLKSVAYARYIRMSPYKVRRVLDQIRGRSYEEALMILEFMPYRACDPVLKVLYSAASNAKDRFGLQKSSLVISEARADKGPTMKRFRPRAQGRGFPIQKPTCHIIVTVQSKN
jgi:large subunit ribosomal protein L22|uniref:Large ribosomal subunit protein uL22c n=1 Tax=Eutreptiella gymnastica TaxID=73025 RepID=I0J3K3_9EUGL|nr:ribosomal protein L22 [Eutreptiella gymnastica]CCE26476.1 ribosomal protein L22 [Eutreptiella gymnastica]